MRNFIFSCIIGIIFMGTGFLFGYILSSVYTKSYTTPSAQSSLTREISDESVAPAPPADLISPVPSQTFIPSSPTSANGVYYFVQGSNNNLYIYEINGSEKELIKTFAATLDILPAADKSLLENGIKADSLSEAYCIAENFTS